jgi:hypothetical protein
LIYIILLRALDKWQERGMRSDSLHGTNEQKADDPSLGTPPCDRDNAGIASGHQR